jgi:hypothetical protein
MSSTDPTEDELIDEEEQQMLDELAIDQINQDEIDRAIGMTSYSSYYS